MTLSWWEMLTPEQNWKLQRAQSHEGHWPQQAIPGVLRIVRHLPHSQRKYSYFPGLKKKKKKKKFMPIARNGIISRKIKI